MDNIVTAVSWFLQHSKMELALATDIVGDRLSGNSFESSVTS
jgi:hypothetical protein